MISEQFFENETEDVFNNIVNICNIFLKWHRGISDAEEVEYYHEYVDAYAAFESYLISNSIEFKPLKFTPSPKENVRIISFFFEEQLSIYTKVVEERLAIDTIEYARNKYKNKFKIGFAYEFTDGDLKRIQTLLNELRELVTESDDFEAEHKERILKRLEKLQQEMHKRVSSLDKFWGLIGDAGVAIGKFGKDAKPFVDRIREISQIAWNTQARAEELPSGTKIPLLENNSDE